MSLPPLLQRYVACAALMVGVSLQPSSALAQDDDVPEAVPDYIYAGFDEASSEPLDAIDVLRLADGPDQELGVTEVEPDLWMIPFEAVSIGSGIRLAGQVSEATLRVPLPAGLKPETMRATLSISPDVRSGFIEYSGKGSPARSLDLDGGTLHGRTVEVEIDLSRFEVVNGQISISFRSRLRSEDGLCVVNLIGAYVDLRAGAFILSGQPDAAATVASFVPRLLETITIALPSEPSPTEAELAAAVAIAATRAAIGGAPTIEIVEMVSSERPPPPSPSPADRLVVISHDLPVGLNVRPTPAGRHLEIGGTAEQMRMASALVLDPLVDLAIGSNVSLERVDLAGEEANVRPLDQEALASPLDDPANYAGLGRVLRFSLRDLNISGTKLVGIGRMEMPIGVTQSQLGGTVVETVLLDESGEFVIERIELAIRTIAALQRVSESRLEATFMSADEALALDKPALVVSPPSPGLVKAHPLVSLAVRGDDIQEASMIAPPDYLARAVPLAVGGTFIMVVGYVMNLVRLRRVRKIRALKEANP